MFTLVFGQIRFELILMQSSNIFNRSIFRITYLRYMLMRRIRKFESQACGLKKHLSGFG